MEPIEITGVQCRPAASTYYIYEIFAERTRRGQAKPTLVQFLRLSRASNFLAQSETLSEKQGFYVILHEPESIHLF